jgi:hypothetical protein
LLLANPASLEGIVRSLEANGVSRARTDTESFLEVIGIDPATFNRGILELVTGRPARVAPRAAVDPTDAIFARFSPTEREAVLRLRELGGWPLKDIVDVYMAANKDENVTANVLLSQ